MERTIIEFNGVKYNAVELDGSCVGIHSTITIAEDELNDVINDIYDHTDGTDGLVKYRKLYDDACGLDDTICGYAPSDLILNGTDKEITYYVKELYA